jgi:hypothetical protein
MARIILHRSSDTDPYVKPPVPVRNVGIRSAQDHLQKTGAAISFRIRASNAGHTTMTVHIPPGSYEAVARAMMTGPPSSAVRAFRKVLEGKANA